MMPVGKAVEMGKGRQLGVRLVIIISDTCNTAVWSGSLGAVRRDEDNSGEYPCGVTTTYQTEAVNISEEVIWTVGMQLEDTYIDRWKAEV